jgi:hypothetical protein
MFEYGVEIGTVINNTQTADSVLGKILGGYDK